MRDKYGEKGQIQGAERASWRVMQEVIRNPQRRRRFEKYLEAAQPLLQELADAGFPVETLDDLRHRGKSWEAAIPVLSRWLLKVDDLNLKESVVRCLSVPWSKDGAIAALIEEFRKYAVVPQPPNIWVGKQLRRYSDEEQRNARAWSVAWAIGNALSIANINGFENQIIELSKSTKYGMARQMLVLGLGRIRSKEAESTALALLKDEDVRLHAIIALGKMKSRRAVPALEALRCDKEPTVRREVRRALAQIATRTAS